MGLLAWIIFGGLAGWVASSLTGTRQGCCLNIIVGVLGAFIGGIIMELATGRGFSVRFSLDSFAVAVFGAVVLLVIGSMATRDKR